MTLRLCGFARSSVVIRFALFAGAVTLATASALSQPPPLRIMPLGDSITYGSNNDGVGGGYRYPLYVALTNAGYTVDYVGTQTSVTHPGLAPKSTTKATAAGMFPLPATEFTRISCRGSRRLRTPTWC